MKFKKRITRITRMTSSSLYPPEENIHPIVFITYRMWYLTTNVFDNRKLASLLESEFLWGLADMSSGICHFLEERVNEIKIDTNI